MAYDMNYYQSKADAAAATLQAKLKEIKDADYLTEDGTYGKRAKREEAQAAYNAEVSKLKEAAGAEIAKERQATTAKLTQLRKKAAEDERALLGPDVSFRLLERRMDAMTPGELVQAVKNPRDAWEAAAQRGIAESLVKRIEPKSATDWDAIHAINELNKLIADPTDPALRELEAVNQRLTSQEQSVARLDPVTYQQSLVQRFNLSNLQGPTGDATFTIK
jgi:hypothetical protein